VWKEKKKFSYPPPKSFDFYAVRGEGTLGRLSTLREVDPQVELSHSADPL